MRVFYPDETFFISGDFTPESKIYSHTNENIKETIEGLKAEKVLTVAASGDQLLNLYTNGITNIDTFDINNYAEYFVKLRIAAIKGIDNLEDLFFFLFYPHKKGYQKARLYLDTETRQFWDNLFNNFTAEEIHARFFRETSDDLDILDNNNYLDIAVLEDLKANILNLKHRHYRSNIFDLHQHLKDKYDAIILSNIYDYCNRKYFLEYLETLKQYLNPNGKLLYSYKYCYDNETLTDLLSDEHYTYEPKEDFEDTFYNTTIKLVNGSSRICSLKDGVLIYQKR